MTDTHVLGPHPDPEKAAKGWVQCACGSAPTTKWNGGGMVCPETPGLVTYCHRTEFTHDLPERLLNLRPVDETWMAQRSLARVYSPVWTGHVRVESLPGMPKVFGGFACHALHAHDGTGVLMFFDYHAAKVRWFAYGCDHKYRGLSPTECRERGIYHGGRCYHVSECTECGHVNAVDSSD